MAAQKHDPAYVETEAVIRAIESRVREEYRQAAEEVKEKLDDYLRRFALKDTKWKEWVEEGKKTEAEYKEWRTGQIAIGKRWEEMKDSLAADYHNANIIAQSIIRGYMPEVYAVNHNYGTFEAEMGGKVDTSYTLYDRQTVERLMRDNPQLLPDPGKRLSKRIANGLDVRWNRQQIQSAIMQSILQGEDIGKMASRLSEKVADSNYKAAVRNARTAATGAQNAGRRDSYTRAAEMGIKMKVQWLATLDDRTRHSHRQLDGMQVEVDEPFVVDDEAMGRVEIYYPAQIKNGTSDIPQQMIWNCRCSLRGIVDGLEPMARKYRSLEGTEKQTYEEWKAEKKSKSNPILQPIEKQKNAKGAWARKYRSE